MYVESTQTGASVGSAGLENSRAMISLRCNVERGAVARGGVYEIWPGVKHLRGAYG